MIFNIVLDKDAILSKSDGFKIIKYMDEKNHNILKINSTNISNEDLFSNLINVHFVVDTSIKFLNRVKNINPNIKTILFGDIHTETKEHLIAEIWEYVLDIINTTEDFNSCLIKIKQE